VDLGSNRATVTSPEGVTTPLWDGVHRLQDGSTVTVRSGLVVPNQAMLEVRAGVPQPFVTEGASACLRLVRKTCGLHDECADQASCSPARQLLDIEREEEKERATYGSLQTFSRTLIQCQEGLADEGFFVPCTRPQRGKAASPCERLVDRVCGSRGQCADASSCSPARQLLETEHQERLAGFNPDAATATSGQCTQALAEKEFFTTCAR
jgi:hypothetical protein